MNNPDHISESLEPTFGVKTLKLFDADPGWKKFGSGINIPDPQPGSTEAGSHPTWVIYGAG
jgi:hypothetical protein